jgi:hypothetical protein
LARSDGCLLDQFFDKKVAAKPFMLSYRAPNQEHTLVLLGFYQSLPSSLIVATAFFAAAFRPFFPRVTFASFALLLSFLFLAAFFAASLRFFFHSGVIMSASFVSKMESVVDHGQPIIFASRSRANFS